MLLFSRAARFAVLRAAPGGLGAGKGCGRAPSGRSVGQCRADSPAATSGPATSGPSGTPRLPAARGVSAEVTHAGSGSPSEPRGLRPTMSSVRAESPGTRVCSKIRSPVKAATDDAAIKARCGAPAAKRAPGPSPSLRHSVPRVRGLSLVQDSRTRKGKENERGVA